VAHSGRLWSAHHTWQNWGTLTCPVYSTRTIPLGRTCTYLLLVILVGGRGDRTRNPWAGSQVFYHWAKSPHKLRVGAFIRFFDQTLALYGNVLVRCFMAIGCSVFEKFLLWLIRICLLGISFLREFFHCTTFLFTKTLVI